MRPIPKLMAWLTLVGLLLVTQAVWISAHEANPSDEAISVSQSSAASVAPADSSSAPKLSRLQVLVASFTVFTLAVIVGFEIIAKVPPTLHTPLMSGSNAISGITVVGALIAAGNQHSGFGAFLGLIAVILANINVVGGFWVTHRMLLMFKKK